MVGEPFSVEVTLHNRKSWLAVWLLVVRDHVTGCRENLALEVLFIRCPAGGEQRGHYQLQLRRRGKHYFGPFYADTKSPLGLVERGLNLPAPGELLVYPWIGRLRADWRTRLSLAAEQVSRSMTAAGRFTMSSTASGSTGRGRSADGPLAVDGPAQRTDGP